MSFLLLTPVFDLLVVNVVVSSLVLGTLGLLSAHFARRASLPLRHRLLTVALLATVVSPLPTWLASARGIGIVPIRVVATVRDTRLELLPTSVETLVDRPIKLNALAAVEQSILNDSSTEPNTAKLAAMESTSSLARRSQNQRLHHSRTSTVSEIIAWAVIIWMAGVLWLFVRLCRGLVVVNQLRGSMRVTSNVRLTRAAQRALSALGQSKTLPIYESPLAPVPLTLGWWRCAIIVPEGLIDSLDEEQLVFVLAHEAAHVVRRDTFFAFLRQMAEIGFWWNPFVRALNHRINALREQICDDLAVKHLGNGLPLAHAIVKVVEWSTNRSTQLPLIATLLDGYDEIETRITRLAEQRRTICVGLNARSSAMIGLLGLMLVAVPFLPIVRSEVFAAPDDLEVAPQAGWKVRIRAVDAEGKLIANPQIGVQWGSGINPQWHEGNQDGEFTVTAPNQLPRYCYLFARANGYAPMRAFWSNRNDEDEDLLPAEFTFEMTKSTTVGGMIVDEMGRPVQGANVEFSVNDARLNEGQRSLLHCYKESCVTDKDGQWRCHTAPVQLTSASFVVNHPDYATAAHGISLDDKIPALIDFKHQWTLKKGFSVKGRVVDAEGQPIAGASLAICRSNLSNIVPIQRTDADGRYQFDRVSLQDGDLATDDPISLTVSVVKPGFAPVMERVPGFGKRPLDKSTSLERIADFTLKPGVTIRLKIVDAKNQPIAHAWVNPASWRDTRALECLRSYALPDLTDEDGIWQWDDAPPGETIWFCVEFKGFARIQNDEIKVDKAGTEKTLVMRRPQIILGTVIDATTNKRIPNFVVERAFEKVGGYADGLFWTSDGIRGKDGEYRGTITMPPHNGSYTYRVLAEGYEPAVSKSIRFEEGEKMIDFKLKPKKTK